MVRKRKGSDVLESKSENFFCKKFLLFLSADLVGSTAFKQANSHLGAGNKDSKYQLPPWASEIANFYRLFPHEFKSELARACDDTKPKLADGFSFGKQPELWKAVGDELIFKKEISDSRQIAVTVLAWIRTLTTIKQKLGSKTLNIKSFIWTAGFPVMNNEMVFERNINSNSAEDENLEPVEIIN